MLLNIWQGIIVRHPDAAARECRTLLPGLVKIAWSWSHGQTPEYFREQVYLFQAIAPFSLFYFMKSLFFICGHILLVINELTNSQTGFLLVVFRVI